MSKAIIFYFFSCNSKKLPHFICKRSMGLITRQWERKRFYKNVTVYKEDRKGQEVYGVKLDQRLLRTPLTNQFLVPSECLALAVAQEWDSQEKFVQLPLMHLTALCNSALDARGTCVSNDDASAETGVVGKGSPSKSDVTSALKYLETDTLCYRVSEPEELVVRQEQEWGPIVNWFNRRFQCEVPVTTSQFIAPPPSSSSSPLSSDSLSMFMTQMDKWSWTGFKYALESCSSFILACALHDGHINSTQASELARLESRYQVSRWGEVEWYHTVEETDLKSRLSATVLLKEFARNNL